MSSGKIVVRFLIDPVQEQKKTVGKIAHAVTYLGNVAFYPDPNLMLPETPQNAQKVIRDLASQLRQSLKMVPFYRTAAKLGVVLKPEDVEEAANNLVAWSNHLYEDQHMGRQRRIDNLIRLLKLNEPTKMTEEKAEEKAEEGNKPV